MAESDNQYVELLDQPFDLHTLVGLRHQVERCAAEGGLADLVLYRFVMAVNEITTNAVRHGGGSGRLVMWRTGDRLHCRVSDRGPGMSGTADRHAGRPPQDALSGRGLWLARKASESLTVHSGTGGTAVTLTHRTNGPAEAVA
jgi:anti-sigma regulatory factor (Ser/Thr protein kinase)